MTRRLAVRWLVLALLICAGIVWVSTAGEGDEALVRSFLRSVLRRLF